MLLCLTATHGTKWFTSTKKVRASLAKPSLPKIFYPQEESDYSFEEAQSYTDNVNEAIQLLPQQVDDIVSVQFSKKQLGKEQGGLAMRGSHGKEVPSNFM